MESNSRNIFAFNRILVVRTDRLGDVVLTIPSLKALREAYPGAHITVLINPATRELVEGNLYINDVLLDDRKGRHNGFFGFFRLIKDIRDRRFDLAVVFHTKKRTNLLCFLAGIPHRLGYKSDKYGFLLTLKEKDERHLGLKHEVDYCLDLLKAIEVPKPPVEFFIPVTIPDEKAIVDLFTKVGLNSRDSIVMLHIGASDQTKLWPAASFASLSDAMVETFKAKVILIGGPDIAELGQKFTALAKHPVLNLIGMTTIRELYCLMKRASLVVSNPSGPMHLAAAAGVPVIGLFFFQDPGIGPARWQPYGPKGYFLTNKPGEEVVFHPDGTVKSGRFDSITVPEVLDVCHRILRS